MGKWVRIDRRYNNPYRLTRYAKRVITTWVVLVIAAIVLADAMHGWVALPAGLAVAGYTGYRVRSRRRVLLAGRPGVQPVARPGAPALRFNPPPGWPVPAGGWTPPPGWRPDLSWPQPPPGWRFWVPDGQAPVGERNTRSIPQDVKIAVAARDGGRCRQCGSAAGEPPAVAGKPNSQNQAPTAGPSPPAALTQPPPPPTTYKPPPTTKSPTTRMVRTSRR